MKVEDCYIPSLGFATKVRACKVASQEKKPGGHISCSQECKRVRGNESSHSQMNSHFESWSPKWTHESLENDYRG